MSRIRAPRAGGRRALEPLAGPRERRPQAWPVQWTRTGCGRPTARRAAPLVRWPHWAAQASSGGEDLGVLALLLSRTGRGRSRTSSPVSSDPCSRSSACETSRSSRPWRPTSTSGAADGDRSRALGARQHRLPAPGDPRPAAGRRLAGPGARPPGAAPVAPRRRHRGRRLNPARGPGWLDPRTTLGTRAAAERRLTTWHPPARREEYRWSTVAAPPWCWPASGSAC